ncbi:MAG: hypothetical protein CL534_13735 [Ahrensia sp.]|nr:hypothetical protein [Ahrensia sp.]
MYHRLSSQQMVLPIAEGEGLFFSRRTSHTALFTEQSHLHQRSWPAEHQISPALDVCGGVQLPVVALALPNRTAWQVPVVVAGTLVVDE